MTNPAMKARQEKERFPERFCKEPRCLWKVMRLDWKFETVNGLDYKTEFYGHVPDCPGGRCPKHQRKSQ